MALAFFPKGNDLGMPIIVKGNIVSNSIKNLKDLDMYPKGVKGFIWRIVDLFSNNSKKKQCGTRKFILSPVRDYEIHRAYQGIRLNFDLVEDMITNIPQSVRDHSIELFDEYTTMRDLFKQWLTLYHFGIFTNNELDIIEKSSENSHQI